jgi:Ca2+-binding RTX toxin-like protein
VLPQAGRRLTAPAVEFFDVTVGGLAPATDQDFGSAVRADLDLAVPPSNTTGSWTVYRNGGRVEVFDSNRGVLAGARVEDLYSVTVTGSDLRPSWLTIDLASGGFFAPPGGITFRGGALPADELRFRLGRGNNVLLIRDGQAALDAGFRMSWDGVEFLGVQAGGGDDQVQVLGRPVAGPTLVDGGSGDDVLTVELANAVVLGGDGNDYLSGGAGRSLLIGGKGYDVLYSQAGSDGGILIGGSTAHDGNETVLRALLAEWSAPRPLAVRIANLRDGSGSTDRLNGDYFLDAGTLIDDSSGDVLIGDSRADWFLAFPADLVFDRNPGA